VISRIRRLPTVVLLLALGACSGGSNSPTTGTAPPPANPATPSRGCDGSCVTADSALTVSDVQTVLARAIAEARGRGAAATIAVVDRVGNTLAIYRMRDGRASVSISSTRGVTGGLAATDPRLVPYGAMTSTFYTGLGCLLGPSLIYLVIRAVV